MAPAANARQPTKTNTESNLVPMTVPSRVGPPPMAPATTSQGQDGRTSAARGPDDAEPLGGVVQGEADDQQRGQRDRATAGGLADREPFGEVVQPEPAAIDMPTRSAAACSGGCRSFSSAAAMAPGP